MIYLRRFSTRDEAQAAVFAYIEAFYNRLRPHSGIGWLAPSDFASSFHSNSAAWVSFYLFFYDLIHFLAGFPVLFFGKGATSADEPNEKAIPS